MKTTAEKIAVMQAFLDGKQIEVFNYKDSTEWGSWTNNSEPYWDWIAYDYRVAPTKPYINPDHIHPDYKWVATDLNGVSYLYVSKPEQGPRFWINVSDEQDALDVCVFASFKPGTCDWRDSLVNIREELK